MMNPGLHECRAERGKVRITTRFWDGIDKPEITALESLAPGQARQWADRLRDAAAVAEKQAQDGLKERLARLQQKRDEIALELKNVDAELNRIAFGRDG